MTETQGVLALSNDDVRTVLDEGTCAELMERGFAALGRGEAVNPPRVDQLVRREAGSLDGATEPTYYRLKTMSAAGTEAAVLRVNSDLVHWPSRAGAAHKEKLPAARGGRYVGFVLAFDPDTGEPFALLPDGYLQRTRVGATAAVGTKYMARDDAAVAALFGSGWQAGGQLLALCSLYDLDEVRVFSPTRAHREAFATEHDAAVVTDVRAVGSPEAALRGADIVHTATNALEPVVDADLLEPGVHVSCLGIHEVGREGAVRADRIAQTWSPTRRFVDGGASIREESIDTKTTESVVVGEPGEIPPLQPGDDEPAIDWSSLPSLADLVTGAAPGRASDEDVTLFLERGLGVQFLATVPYVYERAVEEGLGTWLPDGVFLQSLVP